MTKIIDFRSDTVTKPTPNMKKFMFDAPLGDDVFGEDPTINKLEEMAANLTKYEKALFLPTATQANLIAIMSHCNRGDEYIVGNQAHCYRWEGGGAAVLGSVQPQTIPTLSDGTFSLEEAAGLIKPDDPHFAITKLLCIENTHMGKVLPIKYMEDISKFSHSQNINTHLDGARLFNAACTYNLPVSEITKHLTSTTLCLSKGLGAPAGALLCSNKDIIKRARRIRKMLGGGMRQAGIIAAAGIFALENNIQRLGEDHQNAQLLFNELKNIQNDKIKNIQNHTNMIFFDLDLDIAKSLEKYLAKNNIRILVGYTKNIRLVTHLDINHDDIIFTANLLKEFFK